MENLRVRIKEESRKLSEYDLENATVSSVKNPSERYAILSLILTHQPSARKSIETKNETEEKNGKYINNCGGL